MYISVLPWPYVSMITGSWLLKMVYLVFPFNLVFRFSFFLLLQPALICNYFIVSHKTKSDSIYGIHLLFKWDKFPLKICNSTEFKCKARVYHSSYYSHLQVLPLESFWRALSKPSMLFIKLSELIWAGTGLRMRLVIMAYIH